MVNFCCIVLWKKVSQLFIITTALLLIGACSSVIPEQAEQEPVSQLMHLQTVPKNLLNRLWLEKFSFSFTGDNAQLRNKFAQQDMLLQTELSKQGINLAAMSFTGIMLAQAQWQQGQQLVHSELGLAKKFDAKKVLHDLQLVNWPIALIKKGLLAGFTVDEKISTELGNQLENQSNSQPEANRVNSSHDKTIAVTKTRRFYHHGQEIIIVQYQQSAEGLVIKFEQLAQGYELLITRLTDKSIVAAQDSSNNS